MKHPELKRYGLLAFITLLISGIYLFWCARVNGTGFPLDDAWIHQTFARNLAEDGQWAFVKGEPSAGSTSPLWTLLISIGYLLHINPVLWTMSLGITGLIFTGVICDLMWRRFQVLPKNLFPPLFGLLIVSEWHLIWAALSGMETILYIFVICTIFYLLLKESPPWLLAGLLTGILVWIRPDGLTMLGPVLLLAVWNGDPWKKKARSVGLVLAATLGLILTYMVFNYHLDGTIWPNTLYAKQTEYAVLREEPLILRFFKLFGQVHIGVGIALIPGFLAKLIQVIKDRDRWAISANLWLIGFIGIYAFQLPVTYQHARYLIPVIPIFLLMGFSGFIYLYKMFSHKKTPMVLVGKSWLMIIIAVQSGFCILGVKTYAMDVAIIETEMVSMAKWISSNLPVDARIATHDIGALGYFTKNELIDLAGLIDPEVIPIIRDEDELLKYIRSRDAEFLVTFPGWYPDLVLQGQKIYDTKGQFSPQAGGENMAIYQMQ